MYTLTPKHKHIDTFGDILCAVASRRADINLAFRNSGLLFGGAQLGGQCINFFLHEQNNLIYVTLHCFLDGEGKV